MNTAAQPGLEPGRAWRRSLAIGLTILAGAAFSTAACRGPSSRSELAYGSAADVERLLATHGAPVKVRDCENLRHGGAGSGPLSRASGVTRALSCRLTISASQVGPLTASLGARPASAPSSLTTSMLGTCAARGFAAGAPGYDAWETRGRSATPGWEYTVLVVHRATGDACFETEYAYS